MPAKIIDGKKMAQELREQLAEKIKKLDKKPHLAVILVGNNDASSIYVRNKQKAALEVGMDCNVYHLSEHTGQEDVLDLVNRLNVNADVDGILVQLPLPAHIDSEVIINAVDYKKDVDGFGPYNAGLLANNERAMVAATPKGVWYMLKKTVGDLTGKHAVIIGRSKIVGRPTASLLLNHDCTVTITHRQTRNLQDFCKQADILIAACGCPKLVKKDWVKDGAVVIDIGMNRLDGRLCGDVDFEEVKEVASYITPVPGGVGPMTIAMLLENVYDSCHSIRKIEK